MIALRHVLRFALDAGLTRDLPRVRALKQRPSPRRPLLTREQFTLLLETAPAVTKNSDLFVFYLRFLALTGAREREALLVRRADVDLNRGAVTIGASGVSKNSKERVVDFSRSWRRSAANCWDFATGYELAFPLAPTRDARHSGQDVAGIAQSLSPHRRRSVARFSRSAAFLRQSVRHGGNRLYDDRRLAWAFGWWRSGGQGLRPPGRESQESGGSAIEVLRITACACLHVQTFPF